MIVWKGWKIGVFKGWLDTLVVKPEKPKPNRGRNIESRLPNWMFKTSGNHFKR
jgi:hypothetical protein